MALRLLIRICSILFALPSFATTYYVDFVGGNDSNNGTSTSTPWKHCPGDSAATGTANSTAPAAGDKIAFKGGVTYGPGAISVKSSGNSGGYITYDGNLAGWGNGLRAIMQNSQFLMNLKNYIKVQNFEFSGGGDCILGDGHATLSQNFWTIYNCHFHDTGGQAITFYGDVNDSTIDSCTFEYINYLRGGDGLHAGSTGQNTVLTDSTKKFTTNALVGFTLVNKTGRASATITSNTSTTITTSAGMKNEGGSNVNWTTNAKYAIRISSARGSIYMNGNRDSPGGIAVGDTFRNKVLRCTTQHNGDTPLFFFGQTNLEVAYNTVLGPNAAFHSNGITHYNTYESKGDAEFHHNYVNHERVCITFEGVRPTATGINLYNNVFYSQNAVAYPISSNGPGQTGTIRIINNVLMGGVNESVGFGSDTWNSVIVRNNILCGPISPGSGTLTASNNVYTHTSSGSESGSFYVTNPAAIFQSTAFDSVDDFNIISSFAGKDQGMDASIYRVTDDYLGVNRPQGAGWDIGAYELQSGGGASIGTINVQNLRISQ
jgi:hypothetical protein